MFSDDPEEYLIAFKDFLVAQHAENEDPAAAALIAEIEQELSKRLPNGISSARRPESTLL
jgi:hypothetical protein